jgi:endonuclease/exonuclease/phosphatase (EEP) superfamily protein YafD
VKSFFHFLRAFFIYGGVLICLFQNVLEAGVAWYHLQIPITLLAIITYLLADKRGYSLRLKYASLLVVGLTILGFLYSFITAERLKAGEYKTELKIMTYNVFFKNKMPKVAEALIVKNDPDLLVLQELTPSWESYLNKHIGKTYPYRKLIPLVGTHGCGIYSKYPLGKDTTLLNKSGRPIAQIVALKVKNKQLLISNLHLASPGVAKENPERLFSLYHQVYNERVQQVKTINQLFDKQAAKYDACILAGDFNSMRSEPIYKHFTRHWVDIYAQVGKSFTHNFPNSSKSCALTTIDYIMARGKAKAISAEVVEGGYSDHKAVVATIVL